MSVALLGDVGTGFDDPTHDSQRTFRAVLNAFAHPGRIGDLERTPNPAGPLCGASAAILLTLADGDAPVWLAPSFDQPAVRDFIRFHTGAEIVARREDAAIAVLSETDAGYLAGFPIGTDTYPDRSATLLIQVPSLDGSAPRTWRGPGIDGRIEVSVPGVPESFWDNRRADRESFPCGLDIVFATASRILAFPRGVAVDS